MNKKQLEAHIDKLIKISEGIKVGDITILTGSNGSGKSLIRKIMAKSIATQMGKEDAQGLTAGTSQEARTGSNAEWGALSGALRDLGWTPTSTETVKNIKNLMDDRFADRFIIIDEPEIGMGEETVVGLVDYMNKRLGEFRGLGVLVITHNRYIVGHLNHDKFINVDGIPTVSEWLDRVITPRDLDELEETSDKLFHAIQDRINKNQKKRNKRK